jgi:N6-adenosine-specific RNA methylase IME4
MGEWPFGSLSVGRYGVILADPPWHFAGYSESGSGVPQRADDQHYQTMDFAALAALPVARLAASDCALFMWSTSSHTPQAFDLARRWGFTFSSKAFTWAKVNKGASDDTMAFAPSSWFMGLGHGTRRQTEDCWLFFRGSPRRMDAGVRELIVARIREHSRKPDQTYSAIERLYRGPRCELFSRSHRDGWEVWGNDTGKFGVSI